MNPGPSIDGVLVQWGERLFYPRTRMVKVAPPPHLAKAALHYHAGHIRQRIEAAGLNHAVGCPVDRKKHRDESRPIDRRRSRAVG